MPTPAAPPAPTSLSSRWCVAALASLVALAAGAPAAAAAGLPRLSVTVPRAIPDDPKPSGRLSMREDGRRSFAGRIAIEWRGQSSQMFPKKSYGFEIRAAGGDGRDVGLVGLPADDDWVLYAPYSD